MKKKGNADRPTLPPVQKIELSEEKKTLRLVLAAVLLVIGAAAIIVGLLSMLNTGSGWQEVQGSASGTNCAGDFVLMYDFSDAQPSPTAANKQLSTLYSQATEDAYRLFSAELQEDGLVNVAYLNGHLNETVTVDPALYKAFSILARYDSRYVYLAPAYAEYDRVFMAESDAEARRYDPAQNGELREYLAEIARFANDPQMVNLEMLADNQVRLTLSPEYRQFLEENEIETVLDFGWMKNAFIADFLAETLETAGFSNGYLSSYDGFTRNLDSRGNEYSFNLFARDGSTVSLPARMQYSGPMSIVFLRDYPMAEQDKWHYYAFESGEIVTTFLDTADAMSKSACSGLVSYSGTMGCGEILAQTAPAFISDTLDLGLVDSLKARKLYSIWNDGGELKWNDAGIKLESMQQ